MVKHTKGFKGLSKKVLSAILAASMIMTSSSFVMAAEPTEEPVPVESATGRSVQNITAADVSIEGEASLEFNGKEQRPEVTVKSESVKDGNFTVTYGGDWTNATVNATEKPYVLVTFQGEWAGTEQIKREVSIAPVDLQTAEVNVDLSADSYEYNGQNQVPEISSATIKLGSGDEAYTYTLQSDDYEVLTKASSNDLSDAIDVDTYTIILNGKGNFNGQAASSSYDIIPTAMTSDLVSVTTKEVPYGTPREQLRNYVQVKDINKDEELVPGDDYYIEAEADDLNELGTHTLTITPGSGSVNFDRGEIEVQYTVVQSESFASILSDAGYEETYTTSEDNNVYENAVKDIKQDIQDAGVKANEYEIVTEEADWKDAGKYEIIVRGLQIYEGQEVSIPVVINPASIVADDVEAFQSVHPTSGDLADPTVVITVKGETLVEGTDYTYEIKKQGGKTVAVITGIGNYTTATDAGQKTVEADVTVQSKGDKMSLMDASISAEVIKDNIVYDGKAVTLGASDLSVTERDGSRTITLKWGVDYYVDEAAGSNSYKDNDKPGTASVTIKGMGKYAGERTIEFVIAGESFADDYTATMPESFKLGTTVRKIKDSITVRPKEGTGIYTREQVEFYQNGKKVANQGNADVLESGVYTARISAAETKYTGTYIELTFTVLGEDVSADMKVAEIADQVYTGAQITPSVVVTSKDGKTTYKAGEDYEVVYGENVQAGNNAGSVTVNMIGEYSGSTTAYFNITKADQTITMTNPLQERDLANGTRTTTSKNCTLKLGFGVPDTMNLSYESSDKSVATVDNGVITYQGVGECTITVTANETNNCKAVSLPITVKVGKVGTPTFTPSVTSKTAAKSITVTSSTVRGADGFEVEYSIRPDWWRSTTVDFENTGSKLYRQTIKTYHSNKKYYIRVRAYQVVDGAKVYSDWSPAKTATTK